MKKIRNKLEMINFALSIIMCVDKLVLSGIIFLNIILAIIPFVLIQLNGLLLNAIIKKSDLIFLIFIIIIICTVINNIFSNTYNYLLMKFQYQLTLQVETNIIEKSSRLRYEDFENSKIYDQLRRASGEALTQPYAFFTLLLSLLKCIIQTLYTIILLVNSPVTNIWLLFMVSALLIIPNLKLIYKEYEIQKDLTTSYRKKYYYSFLATSINYVKEIKLFGLENLVKKRFSNTGLKIKNEVLKINKTKNVVAAGTQIIIYAIVAYLHFDCIKNVLEGRILIGEMTVYIQTISKVDMIIKELVSTTFGMYNVILFIEYLFDFMNLNEESKGHLPIGILNTNQIRFEKVSFKYPNTSNYVFEDLNLEVNQGDIVAVIGENGSGKSTILKLLCRLYDIEHGRIMFNGISINDIDIKQWRRMIKVTFQDFSEYEFSFKENIVFDEANNIRQNDFETIIEELKLNNVINKLPNGVESQLGVMFEKGQQLSHGEWQKISNARCFYKMGKILLLDEPSSALDSNNEQAIFLKVRQLIEAGDIICAIFITHNNDNLKYATKVLKISEAKVAIL